MLQQTLKNSFTLRAKIVPDDGQELGETHPVEDVVKERHVLRQRLGRPSRPRLLGNGECLDAVVLDEDEEAILHLGVGELGAADDFLEREGSSLQEATAHLGDKIAKVGGHEADGKVEGVLADHRGRGGDVSFLLCWFLATAKETPRRRKRRGLCFGASNGNRNPPGS